MQTITIDALFTNEMKTICRKIIETLLISVKCVALSRMSAFSMSKIDDYHMMSILSISLAEIYKFEKHVQISKTIIK